jgi:iron complex transport system substrate-binding protein
VHPDNPFAQLIAWDNPLKIKAPDLDSLYLAKSPQLKQLPMLDNAYLTDSSVERAVQMQPDLNVFDFGVRGKLKESRVLDQLAAIGIPVVFIDFRLRPLTNSVTSKRLLGKVLGGAEAWARFYEERLNLIRQRTAGLNDKEKPLNKWLSEMSGHKLRYKKDCLQAKQNSHIQAYVLLPEST